MTNEFLKSACVALFCATASPVMGDDHNAIDHAINPLADATNTSSHELYVSLRVIHAIEQAYGTLFFSQIHGLDIDYRGAYINTILETYPSYERDLHEYALDITMQEMDFMYGDEKPYYMALCPNGVSAEAREMILGTVDEMVGLDMMSEQSVDHMIEYFSQKHLPSLSLVFYHESLTAQKQGMNPGAAQCNLQNRALKR